MARRLSHFNDPRLEAQIQELIDESNRLDNEKETPGGAQAKVDAHANESSVHSATSVVTANRIIIRDTSGRAEIAIPTKSNEIANKAYVDARVSDISFNVDGGRPYSVYGGYELIDGGGV